MLEILIYKGISTWQQGCDAARAGKRLEDNPYFYPKNFAPLDFWARKNYQAWKNGWTWGWKRKLAEIADSLSDLPPLPSRNQRSTDKDSSK